MELQLVIIKKDPTGENRPVSFTEEDREMLERIYDVVVRGGSAGGYGGVRRRAIPALGTLPDSYR